MSDDPIKKGTLIFTHAFPVGGCIKVRARVEAATKDGSGYRKYVVDLHINKSRGLASFETIIVNAKRDGVLRAARSMAHRNRRDIARAVRDRFLETSDYEKFAHELGW